MSFTVAVIFVIVGAALCAAFAQEGTRGAVFLAALYKIAAMAMVIYFWWLLIDTHQMVKEIHDGLQMKQGNV